METRLYTTVVFKRSTGVMSLTMFISWSATVVYSSSDASNHCKLVSWTQQWVHHAQMTSTVTIITIQQSSFGVWWNRRYISRMCRCFINLNLLLHPFIYHIYLIILINCCILLTRKRFCLLLKFNVTIPDKYRLIFMSIKNHDQCHFFSYFHWKILHWYLCLEKKTVDI